MPAPATEFADYLADGETVVIDGVPGTLIEGTRRRDGAIGVTDRRLLFRSTGEWFMDISHDAIHSIQSHPRSAPTSLELGYLTLLGVGALVATVAIGAVVLVAPGGVAFLTALTVGAVLAAEAVRRAGIDADELVPRWLADALHDVVDGRDALRPVARRSRIGSDRDPLLSALVLLAVGAGLGLVVVAGSLAVLAAPLVALFGIGIVDHAHRQRRVLAALGAHRRHERALRIHLASGRQLQLRVDAGRRLDHELSGAVRTALPDRAAPELTGA